MGQPIAEGSQQHHIGDYGREWGPLWPGESPLQLLFDFPCALGCSAGMEQYQTWLSRYVVLQPRSIFGPYTTYSDIYGRE